MCLASHLLPVDGAVCFKLLMLRLEISISLNNVHATEPAIFETVLVH